MNNDVFLLKGFIEMMIVNYILYLV